MASNLGLLGGYPEPCGPMPLEDTKTKAVAVRFPLLGLLLMVGGCLGTNPRQVVRGPLASRPQHPLGLTFLALRPRTARTQAPGTSAVGVQTSYTSIYEANTIGVDRVVFDGELSRSSVLFRRGLAERVDLELELGLLYTTSGFLDSTLERFHGVFFLPDGGRSEGPRDRYAMHIDRAGDRLYGLEEDRLGFTDSPLVVTAAILDEEPTSWRPGVAMRAGLELPTGSEERGFGSGGVDWGAGVLVEKSRGRWTWTAAVDLIAPDPTDSLVDAGVEIRDFVQLQSGAEFRWSNTCSVLAQLFLTTPFTRDIELEEINREILDLGLGLAFDVSERSRLVVSFHEDLVAATGPDFTLRIGWTWGF